jgi:hypothetical protein
LRKYRFGDDNSLGVAYPSNAYVESPHGDNNVILARSACQAGIVHELSSRFFEHVQEGLWKLIPVHEALLRRTTALIVSAPPDLFIRTADAVHLATAFETGEREVWTNDRHMLASASYFGLMGRSV